MLKSIIRTIPFKQIDGLTNGFLIQKSFTLHLNAKICRSEYPPKSTIRLKDYFPASCTYMIGNGIITGREGTTGLKIVYILDLIFDSIFCDYRKKRWILKKLFGSLKIFVKNSQDCIKNLQKLICY